MVEHYHLKGIGSVGFCLALLLLLGSAQDAGDIKTISPDENLSLDSSLRVPGASALPGEAKVNTVAPALGPGVNYTSIQEAIDNSDPGDVIRVQSGTYDEVVTVNKPGLSLKGEDSGDGSPVVSGDGVESTVTLSSDGCSLEGFVVINSGNPHAGIDVKSSNNTIVGNTIMENQGYGIHVGESTRNNTIFGNDALSNGFHGISLDNTSRNNITANNLSSNNMSGIYLENSRENRLSENLVADNEEHGIYLFESHRNFITRNIANNNRLSEIELVNSEDNVLEGNLVIEVEKTADRAEGRRSEYINFTIQISNIGQVDLDSVTVIDWLPPGLEYVTDNRSGQIQGDKIAWKFGTLAGSESEFIELTARFDGTEFGVLTNLVNVTGTSPEGVVVHHLGSEEVISIMRVVPGESISAAIDLMDPGSIIEVESGTYHENLILDKTLVLRGVDTGEGMPTLMGDGVGSTITLVADGCTIESFEVTGSGNPHAGIEIVSNNNSISNNVIRGNKGYGVRIFEARGNTVTSNKIQENGFDGVNIEKSNENEVIDNLISINGKSGISLVSSFDNVVSANKIVSNDYAAILLTSSSNNMFSDNTANDNGGYGIRLDSSSNNMFSDNTANVNGDGIYLYSSSSNTLSDNTANGNGGGGIRLDSSSNNTLSGNTATGNAVTGIYHRSSSNNILSGNTANDNGNTGIRLDFSSSNKLSGNTANGNDYTGIRLISSSSNTLSANTANDNGYYGIRLDSSSNNTLSGNTATGNVIFGIYLYQVSTSNNMFLANTANDNGNSGIFLESSSSNTLSDNTANGNGYIGIRIVSSSNNNTLSENTANDNAYHGICLTSSGRNTLSDNTANSNGRAGIRLDFSSGNTLSGNTATENANIGIYHYSSSNNIFSGNTANDNGDYGIRLISSSNNVFSTNTANGNGDYGIRLESSSNDNRLTSNTANDNGYTGIRLISSGSNTLSDNTANDNVYYGIRIDSSSNNTLSGNTATGNDLFGIYHYSSSNNMFSGNTANDNSNSGIFLEFSSSNTLSDNTANGNGGYGIRIVSSSNNNTLSDNTANDNGVYGIRLEPSSNDNRLTNNTANDNGYSGIRLISSCSNTLSDNTANGNINYGILLDSSSNDNRLTNNTANGNNYTGIRLISSCSNTLSDNTANDNVYYGIYLYSSSNNTLSGNTANVNNLYFGIYLYSSSNNMFSGNTANDNSNSGVFLKFSSSNTLSDNTANGNDGYGIRIVSSSNNNTLSDNTANNNAYYGIYLQSFSNNNRLTSNIATGNVAAGICFMSSDDNTIYQNTFDNVNNSWSDSSNSWNSTAPLNYTYNGSEYTNYTGNWWSDYNGSDPDGNGIGDTPYVIDGSEKDYFPMMTGANATMDAAALAPSILVNLSGDLVAGSPSDPVNLTLNATNPGPENLTSVRIVALIPDGMSYLPGRASVEPDSVEESPNGTWTAAWENVTDLVAGESVRIGFAARIDGDLLGDLTCIASATGSLEERTDGSWGDNVTGQDSWSVYVQDSVNASISVKKTADPPVAEPGDQVTFSIKVTNTGDVELSNITVADLLPAGMSYVSASLPPLFGPREHANGTVFLNWTGLTDLAPGGSTFLDLVARVDDDANGSLTNTASVAATYLDGAAIGFVNASDDATVDLLALNVTKAADKSEVERGGNIAYNITVCNVGSLPIMDLVIEDVFDHRVEIVSESVSRGPDGRWHIDILEPGDFITIILVVKVPRQEFEFEMESRAEGEGFVNVADDYSTTLDPFVIRNVVYALSANTTRQYSDSASVTVLGEPGTELETREHGSGSYESDEQVLVRTLNKSISMNKDVSATYTPTVIGLYRNRTVNYSSRWTEEARAKNRITGTSLSESYRYATSIDRESRIFLDKNESVMEIESEFEGMGHIGFLKKDPESSPGSVPLFESCEDYTGSFRVLEKMDEYGSGIGSEKSASGEGLVLVDKRVGNSQRSYESGAGSYEAEELIRTETNYIAKDLSVASGRVNTTLSPGFSINSSMKWKEGMWSRVANTSFIGEEYTAANELDKETIARGLNEMETLANFTGRARYRAVLEDETEVDFDDVYEGIYSIQRRILLEGMPTYDRPHLSLAKDGKIVYPATDASPLASYTIFIENDGDQTLGPVIVKDLFPPGAVFVKSSLRPSELAEGRAVWTLTHLAIGDRFEIDLVLNLTGYRDDEIVNQVVAEGGYNDNWARAENFSAVEIDWLRCCPSGDIVTVTKSDQIDGNETNVVLYTITVENVGDGAAAAVVTDTLPDGMVIMEASPEFASLDDGVVTWNLIDFEPEETRTISYRVEAEWSGRFVNRVRVDASLVDGSGTSAAYASSVVEVGEFEGEVPVSGWQPPEWDLNETGYSADLNCEEICELF